MYAMMFFADPEAFRLGCEGGPSGKGRVLGPGGSGTSWGSGCRVEREEWGQAGRADEGRDEGCGDLQRGPRKNLYEGPMKDTKTEVVWEEETESDEEENEQKAEDTEKASDGEGGPQRSDVSADVEAFITKPKAEKEASAKAAAEKEKAEGESFAAEVLMKDTPQEGVENVTPLGNM
jgi:hypothetical protein